MILSELFTVSLHLHFCCWFYFWLHFNRFYFVLFSHLPFCLWLRFLFQFFFFFILLSQGASTMKLVLSEGNDKKKITESGRCGRAALLLDRVSLLTHFPTNVKLCFMKWNFFRPGKPNYFASFSQHIGWNGHRFKFIIVKLFRVKLGRFIQRILKGCQLFAIF